MWAVKLRGAVRGLQTPVSSQRGYNTGERCTPHPAANLSLRAVIISERTGKKLRPALPDPKSALSFHWLITTTEVGHPFLDNHNSSSACTPSLSPDSGSLLLMLRMPSGWNAREGGKGRWERGLRSRAV